MTDVSNLSVAPAGYFDAVVHPCAEPLVGSLDAQPSKNYTTRYLLAAGLADGTSTVYNCATSADSEALQRCLDQLGCEISFSQGSVGINVRVKGVSGQPRIEPNVPVNPGNAGAVLRFLLAVCALLPEVTFVTEHLHSLGKRPNLDLLEALAQLGCRSKSDSGRLPISLYGGDLRGGAVTINGSRSSQFLSGLLFLAPLVGSPVEILVEGGLVSKAPVRQTLEVLRAAGINVEAAPELTRFYVTPASYKAGEFHVNGDWPGSAAILAAVAITGGEVRLSGLRDDEQGEKASADVLRQMGADFIFLGGEDGVNFSGPAHLKAIEFDGDLATDAVLALIGAACFAEGRSRFYNVSNLRIKECDRISEPLAELRKLGVKCWEGSEFGDSDPDAIIIEGNPAGYAGGVTVDGRDDHRVIMLLSIVALKCQNPVRILRAHQVNKSYPEYFDHLRKLGARVDLEEASA